MAEIPSSYRHAPGAQPFGPYKVESHVRRNDIYEQYQVVLESGMRLGMKSISPELAPLKDSLRDLKEPFSVGLLSVLDFGQGSPTGDVLVVTESTGTTLRDRLATGGPMSPTQALSHLREMAAALGALESRGLPMPTLSPEAVCLRQDGVRLDDYFLPLLFDGKQLPANFFLARYSAPELDHSGPGSKPTLFSLGIVFYEMLTGRHPFEGSPYQVIASIRTTDADLSQAPEAARPLLSKLLARDPAARFASLAELSEVFGTDSVEIQASDWNAATVNATAKPARASAKVGPRLEPLPVNEFGRPEFRRTQDGAIMVLVPGSTFAAGGAEGARAEGGGEKPYVSVEIESFLIDKHPVTWEMFAAMHAGHDKTCEFCAVRHQVLPSRYMPSPMASRSEGDRSEIERRFAALNDAVSSAGGENIPVSFLTWREMRRYAETVGAELPCEVEWEHANRAGTHTLYPWGKRWTRRARGFSGIPAAFPTPSDRRSQTPGVCMT